MFAPEDGFWPWLKMGLRDTLAALAILPTPPAPTLPLELPLPTTPWFTSPAVVVMPNKENVWRIRLGSLLKQGMVDFKYTTNQGDSLLTTSHLRVSVNCVSEMSCERGVRNRRTSQSFSLSWLKFEKSMNFTEQINKRCQTFSWKPAGTYVCNKKEYG